jgi:phage terminase small subunit
MTEAPQILELTPAIIQQQSSTTAANAAQSVEDRPSKANGAEIALEDRPLTPKEQIFVLNYCGNGFNASQAHRDSGYAAKSDASHGVRACIVLQKPNVRKAVLLKRKEMQAILQARTSLDREWVLRNLQEIVETAKQVEAIQSHGKTVVKWQPQAAVRALELIGKEVAGMFIDRTADVSDTVREREQQLELVRKALALVERQRQETEGEKIDQLNKG